MHFDSAPASIADPGHRRTVEAAPPVFVTAVEAGPLEKQACLLVESLRLWGGRLANAPVIAVRSRRGPQVSRATRDAFARLQVDYQSIGRDDGYEWFPYLNKTAAVKHVAARQSGTIAWLDADILVVGEPSQLQLLPDDAGRPEFVACVPNKNIGTSRDDDHFAPYFRAACDAVGVDYASLPYVVTEDHGVRIRAYWNSGVYAFAGDSGLAELHHDFTLTLVAKGIASHESKLFFSDQIALGLAAHHLGLSYRQLSLDHNFSLQPDSVATRLAGGHSDLRLLHYHGCLWPPVFDTFCAGLDRSYPEVANWLRSQGPLMNRMPPVQRIYKKLLELERKRTLASALDRATYF